MVYVTTDDAKAAVAGHERAVLAALKITPPHRPRYGRIRCPYGTHPDRNPSWRWDDRKARAYCSCGTHGEDIFAIAMKMRVGDFGDAKVFVCEAIGRLDLIRGDGQYRPGSLPPRRPAPPQPATSDIRDSADNLPLATALWAEAVPITGTLASRNLLGQARHRRRRAAGRDRRHAPVRSELPASVRAASLHGGAVH